MRERLIDRGQDRNATIVSVFAYAGLRPGEMLGLTWEHVRSKTLLIEQAVSHGQPKETKTSAVRSVKILPALREDLGAWREIAPQPPRGLVFPSKANPEGPWRHEAYKSWIRKGFKPPAHAIDRPDLGP